MRPALPAAAFAALAAAPPALACSVCTAGDPLVAVSDASHRAGELRLALDAEWLTAEAGMDGMPGAVEQLDQETIRLGAVFAPAAGLNLVAQLPLVRKAVSTTDPAGLPEHGDRQLGVGDVELGARWFFLDRTDYEAMRRHALALSAGSSLPTGSSDARSGGVRLDEHSQIGTGAFGPYLGVLYRLEQSVWSAFASVTVRARTENARGYRYGASLAWTAQGQVELAEWLALGLGLDGRAARQDADGGRPVDHTGGLVLAAAPAVYASLGGGVWLTVRAQIPVATDLVGRQTVGPTVTAGVQVPVL